jgi:hypothetical protein
MLPTRCTASGDLLRLIASSCVFVPAPIAPIPLPDQA